ncbi:MAG: hypothetical protein ABJQ38_18180, partial [Flavobacteriaceae bacterium]
MTLRLRTKGQDMETEAQQEEHPPGTPNKFVVRVALTGPTCNSYLVLRGGIVNRTYGTHKNLHIIAIFTNNIWSYLL